MVMLVDPHRHGRGNPAPENWNDQRRSGDAVSARPAPPFGENIRARTGRRSARVADAQGPDPAVGLAGPQGAALTAWHSRFCDLYRRWLKKLDLVLRQEHRATRRCSWITARPRFQSITPKAVRSTPLPVVAVLEAAVTRPPGRQLLDRITETGSARICGPLSSSAGWRGGSAGYLKSAVTQSTVITNLI